jgi:2-oxoglutarate ferredoxin oxidoreductase subunit beta
MHDGSTVILKKLDISHDPTNRSEAIRVLEEANRNQWLITGLIYITKGQPALIDLYGLPDEPLNRLTESRIRPERETINKLNALMF